MKFRYKQFVTRKTELYSHPTTIRIFKFIWRNYFRGYEIMKLTSWRGAKVSQTHPQGSGQFMHITACPKWAPWLI